MPMLFPSLEFFTALQGALNEDSACTKDVAPSDAYCGLAIGDRIFVLEFDGSTCSAVAQGGNPLDLDFVIAGADPAWRRLVPTSIVPAREAGDPTLAELIHEGALEIRSDDGEDLARASMGMLQAFFDQARSLEVGYV